jgi:hypothetical protein
LITRSLTHIPIRGIKKACHFFAKCAAPKRPIAAIGEKFGGWGIILVKAASKIIIERTPVCRFSFFTIIC